MTTVVHVRDRVGGAVYVGRGTKWGNPFVMRNKSDKERDRVLVAYRDYLKQRPELVVDARRELRGKKLACFCAPLACHADVLAVVADGEQP